MKKQTIAIAVNSLKKSYKNVPVLKDVTFSVQKGTVFALLGSNGAGKTTIINILTTLLGADGGSAIVDGHNVATDAKAVRRLISLTGQFAAVDDMLTAWENLVLIAKLRHEKHPANVATALLKQFDLVDAADRYVATFSGGMRRRLDIAMSLIGDPSIIFLDEPTTGLDPQSRNAMWQTIKNLASDGTTVFLTTQYLEEADQLADKIAILSQGKVVAEGTASDLKKLLPHGKIELTFPNRHQLGIAAKALQSYSLTHNETALSLTITTDGSVKQIAQLFHVIDAANIEVSEFTQKTPTLDDAFLKIVNDNEEKK